MSGELSGKVAIVTGATGGIGRATVLALARAGATVVVMDLAMAAVQQLAAEVGGIAAAGDAAEPDDVQRAVDAAGGAVDILVNHAGIEHVSAIVDTSPEDFDLHWRVNVRSAFVTMRAVLPGMIAAGSGAVVNTASGNSFIANPGTSGYTASKHAVVGLTKVAAMEAGPHGVRVNAVSPGLTDTPMLRGFLDDEGRDRIARRDIPLQRIARPEEVADAVLYLAGPRSGYVTGETLRVDGGLLSGRFV